MNVRTGLKSGNGLGDAVADLAHITGFDKVAQAYERISGKSCGCDQRRQLLNQLVPLGSQVN
jgi:hypothetical protein